MATSGDISDLSGNLAKMSVSCVPDPMIVCFSNLLKVRKKEFPNSVQNTIFIQRADDLHLHGQDYSVLKMDPGVRMDAKAVHDPGYFQRLHRDQPLYICEHYLTSAGNMLEICWKCSECWKHLFSLCSAGSGTDFKCL